jgi:hypothetical protein
MTRQHKKVNSFDDLTDFKIVNLTQAQTHPIERLPYEGQLTLLLKNKAPRAKPTGMRLPGLVHGLIHSLAHN